MLVLPSLFGLLVILRSRVFQISFDSLIWCFPLVLAGLGLWAPRYAVPTFG